MSLRKLPALLGVCVALLCAGTATQAQEATPIKFVLDWKLQGVRAWYYLAQERGYFAQEKLALTFDQGDGSASAVTSQFLKDRPQAVAGLVRAVNKGMRDTVADPDAAIEAPLQRAMAQLGQALELPRMPAVAEVFDRRFLPPLAERQMTLK